MIASALGLHSPNHPHKHIRCASQLLRPTGSAAIPPIAACFYNCQKRFGLHSQSRTKSISTHRVVWQVLLCQLRGLQALNVAKEGLVLIPRIPRRVQHRADGDDEPDDLRTDIVHVGTTTGFTTVWCGHPQFWAAGGTSCRVASTAVMSSELQRNHVRTHFRLRHSFWRCKAAAK